eukprot:9045142-Alexandrium_andersonii.AAC.1
MSQGHMLRSSVAFMTDLCMCTLMLQLGMQLICFSRCAGVTVIVTCTLEATVHFEQFMLTGHRQWHGSRSVDQFIGIHARFGIRVGAGHVVRAQSARCMLSRL